MPEIRCFEDMDQFGAETADELEDLIQDCYHRLIEPRGSNLDDPSRGLGLEDALSGPEDVALQAKIESELALDPRVTAVSATITKLETGSYRIQIAIGVNETELGLVLETDDTGAVRRVQ